MIIAPRSIATTALCLILFTPTLSGCSQGVAEFQLYETAFQTQYEAGSQILDQMSVAERQVWRAEFDKSPVPEFSAEYASYYVDSGDAPFTQAVRDSLNALRDYNAALAGLANGEAAASLTNRAGTLTQNLASAGAGFLAVSNGPLTDISAPAGKIFGLIDPLGPFVENLARVYSRESFRKELIDAYPKVKALMEGIRDGTNKIYKLFVTRAIATPSGVTIAELRNERTAIAAWVVLMNESLKAMESARNAATSNASVADLSALTEASIELRILGEELKAEAISN